MDDYEMIDLENLFDLRDAKLFRGSILSIDQPNNSASIFLNGYNDCAELEGLDLSAVTFFYHCEFSTGTIEDLAQGHKAFDVGDQVYLLYAPENGSTATRLHIIGHYDIRETKKCTKSEYLLMRVIQDRYISGEPDFECIMIFDVKAGSPLDLDAFENLDENSPPKPASFPVLWDIDVDLWYQYNFEVSSPLADVNFTISMEAKDVDDAPEEWGNYNLCPETFGVTIDPCTSTGVYTFTDRVYPRRIRTNTGSSTFSGWTGWGDTQKYYTHLEESSTYSSTTGPDIGYLVLTDIRNSLVSKISIVVDTIDSFQQTKDYSAETVVSSSSLTLMSSFSVSIENGPLNLNRTLFSRNFNYTESSISGVFNSSGTYPTSLVAWRYGNAAALSSGTSKAIGEYGLYTITRAFLDIGEYDTSPWSYNDGSVVTPKYPHRYYYIGAGIKYADMGVDVTDRYPITDYFAAQDYALSGSLEAAQQVLDEFVLDILYAEEPYTPYRTIGINNMVLTAVKKKTVG